MSSFRKLALTLLTAASITLASVGGPASAADLGAQRKPSAVVGEPPFRIFGDFISEFKGGIFAHDLDFIAKGYERGAAINGEVRFVSPVARFVAQDRWFTPILTPRPMIGFEYAFGRLTTDIVYGGATFTFPIWGPVYFDFSFGLAGHNAETRTDYNTEKFKLANPGLDPRTQFRKFVGCDPLFRESIELGVKFGDRDQYSVSGFASHLSHAQFICSDTRNSGMDSAGVRWGYRF